MTREREFLQHYQLGAELLRQGQADRAVKELLRARNLEPSSPLISYTLGLAYVALRDLKRAEEAFLRVVALDPFFSDARNNLGIVYAEQGNRDKARVQFERVLMDRNYATPEVARLNLGKLLMQTGELDTAVEQLRAAVEAKPDQTEWRYQLALALEQSGRLDDARRELTAVVEAEPRFVAGLYHLGYVSLLLKDHGKARECFERVVQLAPNSDFAARSSKLLKDLQS